METLVIRIRNRSGSASPQAAKRISRIPSRSRRKTGSATSYIVRYVFKKGSHLIRISPVEIAKLPCADGYPQRHEMGWPIINLWIILMGTAG
jgi:hypothetical protein